MTVTFSAQLWPYKGTTSWHFVTVPVEIGVEIKAVAPKGLKGFGSVPVKASVGLVRWATSIFPAKATGSYLLPVKAAVRQALGVAAGATLEIRLEMAI